jgi:hypothetical protein
VQETFTESFTVANIGGIKDVDLPQFDPQGGCRDLVKVTLLAEGVGIGDYSFTNDSDVLCTGFVTITYGAVVTFPFPAAPPILQCDQTGSAGPITILLDPGETLDAPGVIDFQFSCTDMTEAGDDLSPFIGTGTIIARYDGDQDSDREVDCDFTDSLNTDFEGTITITYEYTEPCGTGACCLPDGTCVDDVTQQECEDPDGLNGDYQGDDVLCGDLETTTIVWAVSDPGTADTQLFIIMDLDAMEIDTVGPVHADADIEGMTFFDDQVVGSMGDKGGEATLMTMDFDIGDLAFFADLDFGGLSTEIVGMATDDNGVHWAYMEDVGFATIEATGGVGSFSVEIGCDVIDDLNLSCGWIEGLAVSPDGQTLWAMSKYGEIVEIDTTTGNASVVDDISDLFGDDDIENLELFSENELAFITEDGDDLEFSIYNLITGAISTVVFSDTSLDDIESLVIVAGAPCPVQTGACVLGDGQCEGMSQPECEAAGGDYQGDDTDCQLQCPADLDCDGSVGVGDFLALLSAWGASFNGPPDLDGDGVVGVGDFLLLLAGWGPCP